MVFFAMTFTANTVLITSRTLGEITADISKSNQLRQLSYALAGDSAGFHTLQVTICLDKATHKRLKGHYICVSFKKDGRVIDLKPKKHGMWSSRKVTFKLKSENLFGDVSIAVAGWKKYNKRTGEMEINIWRYKNRIWTQLWDLP